VDKVIYQQLLVFGFKGKWTVEVKDQCLHASSLPYFPDIPGKVEEHGLKE